MTTTGGGELGLQSKASRGYEPPYSVASVLSVSVQPSLDQSQCNGFSYSHLPCILWCLLPEKVTQIWQLVPWSRNPWKRCFHLWPPAVVFLSGDGSVLLHSFQAVKEASTPGNSLLSSEPQAQGVRCVRVRECACVCVRACACPCLILTLQAVGNLFSVPDSLRGRMSGVATPLPFF